MIKKLRNQPYTPKSGASSQMGAKRKKKRIKPFDVDTSISGTERKCNRSY
jgi:hypothetical protein